ncbi:MAG: hypothetical protein HOJ34_03890 [Kordiimonadaceae bacterium]|nr:hypothetical protein [Kordiimonadaceae bacterium]MBT6034840.1 hypothetical protein [Kordiimonadaceae bacterium]MBT6328902.1 hypothetical protein [Kordiimonadaceae bacterium]MBT7583862.1 hypothetical protein [Kordiimonadaceae bacterium]
MENVLLKMDYRVENFSLKSRLPKIENFKIPMQVWNRARGKRLMPMWNDFCFEDWIGWHSNLCVTDLLTNPMRQEERIMGEIYREYFGSLSDPDLDQKDYDRREYQKEFLKEFEDYMELQHSDPFICLFEGIVPKESAVYKKIKMIDFPITDDEGSRAVTLISFLIAV